MQLLGGIHVRMMRCCMHGLHAVWNAWEEDERMDVTYSAWIRQAPS